MNIKVLYDHDVFSGFNRGGVSRYFRELGKNLPRCGISTIAFGGLHSSDACDEMPHFIGIRIPPFQWTWRARALIDSVLQQQAISWIRPQVIHKTLYGRHEYPTGIPIIITVHDMAHERGYIRNDSTVEAKAYWIKRATHIITPSEFTRSELIGITGVDPGKVTCIAHGADALSAVQLIPTCAEPYLIYVGDRHAYKDFRVLINALSEGSIAHDYRLLCCGGGRFTPDEIALIESAKLTERIDRIDPDDSYLSALYQQARCLVYPSRYEGFGLPIVEAMKLGCPVVAADTPVSREVTRNAAIFFTPGDGESLREALMSVAYDDQMRSAVSSQGRITTETLTWSESARCHARIYEDAVGMRRLDAHVTRVLSKK